MRSSVESSAVPPVTFSVTLNGKRRAVAAGTTLASLLAELELKPDRLAIELNRRIVKPADWTATAIPDGAEIEIVQFVGGG